MSENHSHHSHPEIIKRLKRAEGQMRGIVEMLDSGRSCVEIAQQLHAVEKAIQQAKKTLIQDHLDNCLEEAIGTLPLEKRRPITEFKEITKYL